MSKAAIQKRGSVIKMNPVRVMGIVTYGVKNSEKAFQKVESRLTSMRGRKFYGLLYGKPDDGEYFACVEVKPEDDPQTLGLEKREIPGGLYARKKIWYWYEA